MQLKQQYLPKFIGLIELHRDSLKINPEMSPSNFSFFEQKPKYSIASFKKPTKRKKLNEL